jgi:hypothetical protein
MLSFEKRIRIVNSIQTVLIRNAWPGSAVPAATKPFRKMSGILLLVMEARLFQEYRDGGLGQRSSFAVSRVEKP